MLIEEELNEIHLISMQRAEKEFVPMRFLQTIVDDEQDERAETYLPVRIVFDQQILKNVDAIPFQSQMKLFEMIVVRRHCRSEETKTSRRRFDSRRTVQQ